MHTAAEAPAAIASRQSARAATRRVMARWVPRVCQSVWGGVARVCECTLRRLEACLELGSARGALTSWVGGRWSAEGMRLLAFEGRPGCVTLRRASDPSGRRGGGTSPGGAGGGGDHQINGTRPNENNHSPRKARRRGWMAPVGIRRRPPPPAAARRCLPCAPPPPHQPRPLAQLTPPPVRRKKSMLSQSPTKALPSCCCLTCTRQPAAAAASVPCLASTAQQLGDLLSGKFTPAFC